MSNVADVSCFVVHFTCISSANADLKTSSVDHNLLIRYYHPRGSLKWLGYKIGPSSHWFLPIISYSFM